MKTELDTKYLVLNWEDINNYLNNTETRRLAMMLKKLSISRGKDGKVINKKYTVVSQTMKIYDDITKMVLDEINGVQTVEKDSKEAFIEAMKRKGKDAKNKSKITE